MRIRVPATTGNTGPGFDSAGLAFALYAEVEVERLPAGELVITGCDARFCGEDNLAIQAFRAVEREIGASPSGVRMHIETEIPVSRGLGSSATMLAAGAAAANELYGAPLSRGKLLDIITAMEGHPDNVAPALYGGLCASAVLEDGRVVSAHYPVHPDVRFVALIPDFPLSTAEARGALPKAVPMRDAIFNISRTALLMRGMEMGDMELLSVALDDKLHSPYRRALIHGFDDVKEQSLLAGARALIISGSGPTLLALSEDAEGFARDIPARLSALKHRWRAVVLDVDHRGTVVL